MSATTRMYRIVQISNLTNRVEFRALAIKEKEFVASNVEVSAGFQTLVSETDGANEFSRFPFKQGETYTEADLIAYAELRGDLKVEKIILSGDTKTDLAVSELESIDIDEETFEITSEETIQLTATGTFDDGSEKVLTNEGVWSSSSDEVATVSDTGLVSGVSSGEVTISYTVGAISADSVGTITSPE